MVLKACLAETTQSAFVSRVLARVYDDTTLLAQYLVRDLAIPASAPQCVDINLQIGRNIDEQTPANTAIAVPVTADGDYRVAAGSHLEARVDVDTFIGGAAWEFYYDAPGFPASLKLNLNPGPSGGDGRVDVFLDDAAEPEDSISITLAGNPPSASFGTGIGVVSEGTHVVRADWLSAAGDLRATGSVSFEVGVPTGLSITAPAGGSEVTPPTVFEGTYKTATETGAGSGSQSASSSARPDGLEELLRVRATMGEAWFARLLDALRAQPGFLGAFPAQDGSHVIDVHFVGEAGTTPAGLVPEDWRLNNVENVRFEKAMRRVELLPGLPPGVSSTSGRTGPPLPASAEGIGPGTAITMTSAGGTVGCTANFVWKNRATGAYYLGAAGHCFLPTTADATHGSGVLFNPSGVVTRACVKHCDDGLFLGYMVQLGNVVYARQAPGHDLLGFGEDFGLVEIPPSLYHLVRIEAPVWEGPAREGTNIPVGEITLHYGNGLALGEKQPTKARAGISNIPWSTETGPFYAIHPGSPGDSGSGVLLGLPTGDERVVVGDAGAGILTHIGIPFGTMAGTIVSYAKTMALRDAGLDVRMVVAGETMPDIVNPFASTITSPADGSTVAPEATAVTVTGTANFPPGAGTGSAGDLRYWMHNTRVTGCTVTVKWMDTTKSAAREAGSGCGQALAAAGYAVEVDSSSSAIDFVFPANPKPATDIFLDASRSVVAEFHMNGFVGEPVVVGDFEARLAYGSTLVASARAVGLPIVDGAARLTLAQYETSIPAGANLYLEFIVHQASPTGAFLEFGGTRASNLLLPLANPPTRLVDVSVDDPTFTEGLLVVDGLQAWTALWDLEGVGSGPHTIYSRAVDGASVSDTSSVTVDLVREHPPVAAFDVETFDLTATFTDLSTPGDAALVSWAWSFGDGTESAEQSPVHVYADAGTYTVSLVVTDSAGLTSQATADVTVSHPPWSVRVRVTDAEGAVVLDWIEAARPSSGSQGTWSFAWDGAGAVEGPHTLDAVLLEAGNAVESASVAFVVVDPNTAPTAIITAPHRSNRGTEVGFNGTDSFDPDGTIVKYEWAFGDGASAAGPSVLHPFSTVGVYEVTLTVTDDDGDTDQATHLIEIVNAAPTAVIEGPTTAKKNSDVTFDGSKSGDPDGSIVAYAWDLGDGATSDAPSVTHRYKKDGSYTVTLTVTDSDGATHASTHAIEVTKGKAA
ncbi:MAG: PKD domain-containing protein [Euryarchaeota archaeon]|nr:PKD domain-containing protein [Euryarchaeota archaeon]